MAAPPNASSMPSCSSPVAQHPVGDPGVDQQPDAVLFEDAGPVGLLDLAPGPESTTTDSMPRDASRWLSIRPAGPPPTMATVVPVSVRVMPEVSDRPSLVTIDYFC